MTGTAGKIIAARAVALALVLVAMGPVRAGPTHTMATFERGSTNYEVTAAFARLVSKHATGLDVQLTTTSDHPGAIIQLAEAKLDFAGVIWSVVDAMANESHPFDRFPDAAQKMTNLRGIFYFPTGVPHLLTFEETGIRSFKDLQGKKIFIGPVDGPGPDFFNDLVLGYAGLRAGIDYEIADRTFEQAYKEFMDGSLDAVVYFGSSPRQQVKIAAISRKVRVVAFAKSELEADAEIREKLSGPGYTIGCIPTNFYGPNQMNDEPQCYHQIWLGVATHKDLPEDVVYAATRAFWENIDEFYEKENWENLGGAVIENPIREQVRLENALIRMNVPLHPGAERYYREKKLLMPAGLVSGD